MVKNRLKHSDFAKRLALFIKGKANLTHISEIFQLMFMVRTLKLLYGLGRRRFDLFPNMLTRFFLNALPKVTLVLL